MEHDATTRYCANTLLCVASATSGVTMPAAANIIVLSASHGPANRPCTLRVMIWQPVSSVAVHSPSPNHVTCSSRIESTKGMYSSTPARTISTTTMTMLPLRGGEYTRAELTAPRIAPTPRAMKTVPTAVDVVLQLAASEPSVEPSATSVAPPTDMAMA